tara:strand:- start:339 stop:524 length:186 start_codon:yes stop_codon:yes gene_type:complete
MDTYSFKTENDFRVDVNASTPKSAFNKLMSIPIIKNMGITKEYIKYNKDGLSNLSWSTLEI